MKKYFEELRTLMEGQSSILNIVDEVAELRSTIIDPFELTSFVNHVRSVVQLEAKHAIIKNNGRGLVAMATGSGKSKVGIDVAAYYAVGPAVDALIVPTEKLRDENWKEEYYKWGRDSLYEYTQRLCYASASKTKFGKFSTLILDEAHNITEANSEFFANNQIDAIVALTATEPTDPIKRQILKDLNIPTVYKLTLDDAVKLGFVAPYKIVVVSVPLNSTDKNVVGGTKAKPFMTTESAQYTYLNKLVQGAMFDKSPSGRARLKFATMKRMHTIYGLQSKKEAAKFILDKMIPQDERVLIFASNIEQAEELCPNFYHSKSSSISYDAFKSGEILRMSCVKAVNEGHNFPNVDKALATQLTAQDKDLIQRIGRIVRFRPGHEAVFYVVVAEGTQDDVWSAKALEGIDTSKIEYVRFINLKNKYDANT